MHSNETNKTVQRDHAWHKPLPIRKLTSRPSLLIDLIIGVGSPWQVNWPATQNVVRTKPTPADINGHAGYVGRRNINLMAASLLHYVLGTHIPTNGACKCIPLKLPYLLLRLRSFRERASCFLQIFFLQKLPPMLRPQNREANSRTQMDCEVTVRSTCRCEFF
jgi:hypothetical protein